VTQVIVREWSDGTFQIAWTDKDPFDTKKSPGELQHLHSERRHEYEDGDLVLARYRGAGWHPACIERLKCPGAWCIEWQDVLGAGRSQAAFSLQMLDLVKASS
jgi:hypothetical protein